MVTIAYLSSFLSLFVFGNRKVLLVLCSHLSSTHEVSQALAGYLALRAPRVLRCQGPRRQSPGRSAAPVIPTKTKSASTTATWISSGSTLLSKIYFCSCPQLPCHARIFRLARRGYLSFVRGERRGKAITLWQTSGLLVPKKKRWSCAVKSVYCGAGHALKMWTAVTFQVMASPAESYVWCQVTRWHEADRAAADFVLKFLAWFFNLIVCFFTFSNSQLLDSGFTITARTVTAPGSYQWGWIHSCASAILPVWKQFLHKEQSETGCIFKICTHVSTELKHRTQNWICKVCWISARIVGTKKKKGFHGLFSVHCC